MESTHTATGCASLPLPLTAYNACHALRVRPRNWYPCVAGVRLGRSIGAWVPRSRALAILLTIIQLGQGVTS